MKYLVLLMFLQGCAFTECGVKGYHYGYLYGLYTTQDYIDATIYGQAGAIYGDMYCLKEEQ